MLHILDDLLNVWFHAFDLFVLFREERHFLFSFLGLLLFVLLYRLHQSILSQKCLFLSFFLFFEELRAITVLVKSRRPIIVLEEATTIYQRLFGHARAICHLWINESLCLREGCFSKQKLAVSILEMSEKLSYLGTWSIFHALSIS